MTKILEALITDFFKDAFPIADILFASLINIVFWVENHISDGSIFQNTILDNSKSDIFFGKLFQVTTSFGVAFLIFKFLKKIFDTYIIGSDGDPSMSVENIVIGFCKGLIIIFSFNFLYEIFVNISIDFINEMLDAVGLVTLPSLMQVFETYFLGLGLFALVGLLIFFICYLILVFQFIKRGLEMLILRLGVPIACVGLIDSDNGVFAPYIKMFIQNSVTVVIQLAMIKLGFGVVANGNIFFGIACMIMGIKTPQFLQQFMIGLGSSGINMMTINQTASMVSRVSRFIRK
ncbi:conjugal transfer protein TrbL family protein [uncultured Tyzzerella sp.]|uniref:conjugal transfer protein TrbL family protein n=1 Tax=uncultured Tyzzerella sp. TaxID=2321398 RepID=UPI0029429B62|nr:conjugal transfer protein TrbL family protein [uncultured Tyzzerella sp.]